MNFIREKKCYLMLIQAGKAVADDGRKSVKFDGDARSLTNIRIVSVCGDCQYIAEIANFNIYNTYWKLTD